MRITIALALAAITLGTAVQADAAGCIKGAAVGGAAGHFVGRGHAVLGAAAGCAYGHHRAAKAARAQRAQQRPQHR